MPLINIGTGPNTGDGESLRSAFSGYRKETCYGFSLTNEFP